MMVVVLTALCFVACSARATEDSYDVKNKGSVDFYSQYTTPTQSYYADGDIAYDVVMEEESEYAYAEDKVVSGTGSAITYPSSQINNNINANRKIIKTVSLDLETKNFDNAVIDIQNIALNIGGYIENSYIGGTSLYSSQDYSRRYATFVLRVPADSIDGCVNTISDRYNVVSVNQSSNDITDTYSDISSRVESLEIQQERLLEMLKTATELEYIIQIEDKLADIRYQLDSYNSRLITYDNQVAMSYINITLEEVVEYKTVTEAPKTFGERISQAFSDSWSDFASSFKNFCVDIVYSIPSLLTVAVFFACAFAICIAIVRHAKKKRVAKKAKIESQQTDNE